MQTENLHQLIWILFLLCTDGLGKKKKRKLTGMGGLYSGVSVSQILAQRERAIAANSTPGLENSTIPNGSQVS